MELLSQEQLAKFSPSQLKNYNEKLRNTVSESLYEVPPEPIMTCTLDLNVVSDKDLESAENIINDKVFEICFNINKYNKVSCKYEYEKEIKIKVKKI